MNIKDYKFSDKSNILNKLTTHDLIVITNHWFLGQYSREDVIQMARHFELNVDDLRCE